VSIANFLELELLDHVTGVGVYTAPTNIYVKLHVGDPGENCTGNAATETTRKTSSWSGPASGGSISTDSDLAWTSVAATETYSHVSLWDHATAGNALWSDALTAPVPVTAGDTFTIASGDMSAVLI